MEPPDGILYRKEKPDRENIFYVWIPRITKHVKNKFLEVSHTLQYFLSLHEIKHVKSMYPKKVRINFYIETYRKPFQNSNSKKKSLKSVLLAILHPKNTKTL